GSNDADLFDLSLPWVGGGPLPAHKGFSPIDLCETPIDHMGGPLPGPLAAGDVPNVQRNGRTDEGQTVLANGMNAGGRSGDPSAPGALAPGASTLAVQPGQGLRLQAINAATTRFFRLRLTADDGTFIPLVRVGGEGGLLDHAVLEGTATGGFDFGYDEGQTLLGPGDRADLVAAIPASAAGIATLWTEDFRRTGGGDIAGGWTNSPTVPVAHFEVSGPTVSPAFTIGAGTALRAATGDPVEVLPAPSGSLLDPATFAPPKFGMAASNMQFTTSGGFPGIDNIKGTHDFTLDYTAQAHLDSTRYAELGDTLELTVENTSPAHHPYHLHGFSIQPISYTNCHEEPSNTPLPIPSFTFPEVEFMDNIDIPGGCTLTFRVRLEDRPMVDGVTPGGGAGRWMIHCHIFFHHTLGMVSELVVTDANGNERPYVDALDPSVTAPEGDPVTMDGAVADPDGDAVTLAASVGTVVDNGGGTWSWSHVAPDGASSQFVYITATDSEGNIGETAFILASENVPPTVIIDPAQVTAIDEGDTLAVSATFTDPGDDDPYTATIDYGDGSGPQPAAVATTVTTPPQAGTVDGSLAYGDDGNFTVFVTVTDADGASGSASFTVTVDNIDPDAIIETAAPVIADVGDPVALDGRATDPGSDDLTTTWSFDDGTADAAQLSLVNPPSVDGDPSPSVQPRNVEHDVTHTFSMACVYLTLFAATDDDGGTDNAVIPVVITAPPAESRSAGYWQHQYGGIGSISFSDEQLECYLEIAAALSDVFNEERSAATIAEAYDGVFLGANGGSEAEKLDRALLVAWLNFANGGIEYHEPFDTDGDHVPDADFAAIMAGAETVRLDPTSSEQELKAQRQLLAHIE
ncbi:MAG: PKD domain-containing protein, partial [Candidatus Limnocylindria bacterium]